MQEKIALRTVLRRVAAVGASVGMLGMTMTGALAADLSTYPNPFDGANAIVVYGADASAADNTAANDIIAGLPQTAGPQSKGTTQASTFSNTKFEKLEDLPLGTLFNSTTDGFGNTIDADDVDGFLDTTIDIDVGDVDDDYDVRDEIRVASTSTSDGLSVGDVLTATTGLAFDSGTKEFKENVFVPMRQDSWGYFYVFEDTLKNGNYLSNATAADEIEIEFLGKLFEIEGTNQRANEVIMNVGQKFYMSAGDTVVVDGKEVTLVQTATSSATVEVDGVREVVSQNSDETINGLEVRIEDVSTDEGIEFDSATIFVGEKARETFTDGEEFIGEDEDDPAWVWQLANLTGGTPILGILWSLDLDDPEETDNPLYEHPLYEGEQVCLPFDYGCIVFDSVQIDDYQDYELDSNSKEDLFFSTSNATNNLKDVTAERVLQFRAKGSNDDGFVALTQIGGSTVETDTIVLAVLDRPTAGPVGQTSVFVAGSLGLFREEQDGSDSILFRAVNVSFNGFCTTTECGGIVNSLDAPFQLDYRDAVIDVDLNWFVPGYPTNTTGSTHDATDIWLSSSVLSWNNVTNPSPVTNNSAFNTNNLPAFGHMIINPMTVGDNVTVYFETDEDKVRTTTEWNDFKYLGNSDSDTQTGLDIVYGNVNATERRYPTDTTRSGQAGSSGILNANAASGTSLDISGWDENARALNGIIILDAEAHQSSDDFEIRVPSDLDDFKANIVVRTSGASSTSGVTPVTKGGPALMTDAEVTNIKSYNAIVVGGPAVNTVSAELLGLEYPTYGGSGLLDVAPGEAVLQMMKNGATNYALLVYGWEAEDTRRAAKVLGNYKDFDLSGMSMLVTGESLDVAGISVQAA